MSKRLTLEEGIAVAVRLGYAIHDHKFGDSSNANLEGVLPQLVDVARLAIILCEYDGKVIADGGLRTLAAAQFNAAKGTGIVDSRHRVQSDGFGHAIDCIALTPGKGIDWQNQAAFQAMADAIKIASAILSVPIRMGCDWNMNGTFGESREWDWAHFENPIQKYQPAALAEMLRYRRVLGLDELQDQGASCECPNCGHEFQIVSA